MPDPDRVVAGIRCRKVLALLSDYLDGDLPESRVDQILDHVAGCDWCEQFGGRFADTVRRLRLTLKDAPPIPEDVADRLSARLKNAYTAD